MRIMLGPTNCKRQSVAVQTYGRAVFIKAIQNVYTKRTSAQSIYSRIRLRVSIRG